MIMDMNTHDPSKFPTGQYKSVSYSFPWIVFLPIHMDKFLYQIPLFNNWNKMRRAPTWPVGPKMMADSAASYFPLRSNLELTLS